MDRTAAMALAQPILIGPLALPNRFVMGAMHTGLEASPSRFAELARFYAERAKGGAGLIVTGGFAPNVAGRMKDAPALLESQDTLAAHRLITNAVHAEGGRIALQILHAGRYGYHAAIVAPSALKSPIHRHAPRELSDAEILVTIDDYARTARLAVEAGYDGVEIMGSEGYLISQFLAPRTNQRTDRWGGSLENRARFPLSVVKSVRAALGPDQALIYRISVVEIVEGGLSADEVDWLGQRVAEAGADCLNTGIGWHEAAIPTIAGIVPHAAFAQAIARLKSKVSIPVAASNRISLPEVAERVVATGAADLVSLARPFLADPAFAAKTLAGKGDLINICMACNQSCLDHYFAGTVICCAINPRAAHETAFGAAEADPPKTIAVVGAGPAGLAFAAEAAERGHKVTLFDAQASAGGHLSLSARIPGKEDHVRTVQGFVNRVRAQGVALRLGHPVAAADLIKSDFDEIVLATGVLPRKLAIPGADDSKVVDYLDVLEGRAVLGTRVVVVGGGAIAHDLALLAAWGEEARADDVPRFERRWGLDDVPVLEAPARHVTMVKRSPGPFGRTLGKSTGWIVRQQLADFGVRQVAGALYRRVEADGLVIEVEGEETLLPADSIVVCAGQEESRALLDALGAAGRPAHVIGGVRLAEGLDAKRAIAEGIALARTL